MDSSGAAMRKLGTKNFVSKILYFHIFHHKNLKIWPNFHSYIYPIFTIFYIIYILISHHFFLIKIAHLVLIRSQISTQPMILYSTHFLSPLSLKITFSIGIQSISRKPDWSAKIAKKNLHLYQYQISITSLIIFLSKKWYPTEGFINHIL